MRQSGPTSAHEVVKQIERNAIFVPGIQRNFVWQPKQICRLLDSLARGYPIGSLLFWKVRPDALKHLAFEQLVTNYKGKGTAGEKANLKGVPNALAVLDGQQRLTALNIALRGTISAGATTGKERFLFVDVTARDPDAGSERNMYSFEFMSEAEAETLGLQWVPLQDVYRKLSSKEKIGPYLKSRGLKQTGTPKGVLQALVEAIHVQPVINYQTKKTDNLDEVLDIFARINNGGTKLSYAELLVSTATRTWKSLNARDEIASLRGDLADIGGGFNLGPERIMKTALVLISQRQPKFSVEGFTRDNVLKIESSWPQIRRSLEVAVSTVASFGLTGKTLTAENALIPIATYAFSRGLNVNYATADHRAKDREKVRSFVARTLLKGDFWTGAVDPILVECRRVIYAELKAGNKGFPLGAIEQGLKKRAGRTMVFTDEEIQSLLATSYQDRRCLLLMGLIYPPVSGKINDDLHKDHVFPRSFFDEAHFRRHRISPSHVLDWSRRSELVPNLQLLASADNLNKSNRLPADWLNDLGPSIKASYRKDQDLQHLPKALSGFDDFWEKRRVRQLDRLKVLLGPL